MGKLLQILRFYSITLFFIAHLNASVLSPLPIDINSTISGVISADSEISPYSNNKSEYYTFTLTEETNIVINMESDFYHKLYLLETNGTVIKESSKYDYLNDKIVVTLSAGVYMIDVTSVFSDNYGAFTLSLKENIILTTPLALDSIVDGEWTSNSAISEQTSQYANFYTFTLKSKTDVLIDLDSSSPYIYLYDENGTKISYAIGNNYKHAKIVKTLEAGNYTIEVSNTGYINKLYTLRFKINNIVTTSIDLNSTVSGLWSISSGISPQSKEYTNYYTFTLDEAKDIVIGIDSNLSYERLFLLDSNMSVIAESFERGVIIKHLPAGNYIIDATLNGTYVGEFSLFLNENTILNSPIDLNSSITGNWNSLSGIFHSSGGYSNYYTFTVTQHTNVVIRITGSNSRLHLLDSNGNRNYFFDFINGTIVAELDVGIYTIEATQFYRQTGSYQLEIFENKVVSKSISLGDNISSTLSSNDGLSIETHNYAKEYVLTLLKRTDIVFDFNASIIGARVALKDNMGIFKSLSHRQSMVLEAGTYILEVSSFKYNTNTIGSFTLSVRENNIKEKPISFNKTIEGSWTEDSGITSLGYYVDRYTFSLTKDTEVIVQVQSQYSMILKIDGYKIHAFNGNNILLSRTLGEGKHTIEVIINEWYDIYKTGDYTLLVQADVEHPSPINALTTLNVGAHSTTITWEKGNDSTVGYKIYLNGTFITEVDASKNSYMLSGLSPESQYAYSVVAYNSVGESEAVKGKFTTKKDNFSWLIPVQYNILN